MLRITLKLYEVLGPGREDLSGQCVRACVRAYRPNVDGGGRGFPIFREQALR